MDRGGSVADFLHVAETLVGPINAFFDNVFVMTEDAGVRINRQALLRCVALHSCAWDPWLQTCSVIANQACHYI